MEMRVDVLLSEFHIHIHIHNDTTIILAIRLDYISFD